METFLYYLLRASVVMALFYGFYKLFFGKNTFHGINRYLLIIIVVMAVLLPIFRFSLLPEKTSEPTAVENVNFDFSEFAVTEIAAPNPSPFDNIPWVSLFSLIFAAGLLFAITRYIVGLWQLIRIIRKSEKQTCDDGSVLCVTRKDISPFSWMKYIVLSRKDVSSNHDAILRHERAHVQLNHSFDMIFFDLFTCLFWFNPFSWLLRLEIQSVHEYQADEQVISFGIDAKLYQLLLIRKSVGEHKFALANNFRQRDLHKRITMMMKTKSKKQKRWNYTVALPVLFLAMIALSVPKLNAKVVETEPSAVQEQTPIVAAELQTPDKKIKISGQVVDEKGNGIASVAIINDVDKSGTVTDKNGNFVLNTQKGGRFFFKYPGYGEVIVTFTKPEAAFKITLSKGEGVVQELVTINVKSTIDTNQDKSKVMISGTVKGAEGALPGVAIVVKDTKIGTVTDMQGGFSINAPKGSTLRFLMFGYKAYEYAVNKSKTDLAVVLQEDDNEQATPKSYDAKLVVRGEELNGTPLCILDGKEISKEELNKIDPAQIESMNVLKNKSATEIYGEKAKDGVIIITSKTGEKSEKKTGRISLRGADLKGSPAAMNFSGVGNKPLVVIDGKKMPKDFNLQSVLPDEIESITVLKGKSGPELYGDDAKDGVLIITKKKKEQ